jgi:hypothetical protein
MAEGNEKDLSIDEEQSEEVAGGLNAAELERKRAVLADPVAMEVEEKL